MTAALAPTSAGDIHVVLRRIDGQLAQRAGDDPLPTEVLAEFAKAVQKQIVEPLLAGSASAAAPPVDSAELDELRRENVRLADEMARNAEAAQRTINALRQQVNQQAEQIDDASKARRQIERLNAEVASARAERDKLCNRVAVLEAKQAVTVRQLQDATAELERRGAHVHLYPLPRPGKEPEPCSCGQPYPRAHIADRSHEVTPSQIEPWSALIDQLRVELAGWPGAKGRAA